MSKNKSRSNIPKLKIGPKTMDGAGSSIEEASPTSNKPQNLPDECELAAHRLYEKAMQEFISKKTIRNNQVNLTPAQAVAKLQKAFPNSEVRLSREGDPELSSVLISSYPQSRQSKTSTPPEQSEKIMASTSVTTKPLSPMQESLKALREKHADVLMTPEESEVFNKKHGISFAPGNVQVTLVRNQEPKQKQETNELEVMSEEEEKRFVQHLKDRQEQGPIGDEYLIKNPRLFKGQKTKD